MNDRSVDMANGEGRTTRRGWLKLAWGACGLAGVGVLFSGVRFLFPNALLSAPQIFTAGRPRDYALGVDTRWLERFEILIVREPDQLYALFAECTHLGCLVHWSGAERQFKCPCHGSSFRLDGDNVEGPAPRPLDRAAVALREDGQLIVDRSRKLGWDQRHQREAYCRV